MWAAVEECRDGQSAEHGFPRFAEPRLAGLAEPGLPEPGLAGAGLARLAGRIVAVGPAGLAAAVLEAAVPERAVLPARPAVRGLPAGLPDRRTGSPAVRQRRPELRRLGKPAAQRLREQHAGQPERDEVERRRGPGVRSGVESRGLLVERPRHAAG